MTIEEVMWRNYTFIAMADPASGGWVIMFPDLPGVMTQADTYEEIGEMAKEALEVWVAAQIEDGLPIPKPGDYPLPVWNWEDAGPALLTTKEVAERPWEAYERVPLLQRVGRLDEARLLMSKIAALKFHGFS